MLFLINITGIEISFISYIYLFFNCLGLTNNTPLFVFLLLHVSLPVVLDPSLFFLAYETKTYHGFSRQF